MKKAAKIFALLGLGTLFIGIFICIAGFAMGGRFHSYGRYTEWMWDRYYCNDISENRAMTGVMIDDGDMEYAYDYDEDDFYKELTGSWDTLDIDIGYGDCYIISGGKQDVVTISGVNIKEDHLSASITSGDVLEISYNWTDSHNRWGSNHAADLTITIPEKQYKKLIVNMEAGEMTIENIAAGKAEIEVGAGQLYLNSLNVADTCTMNVEAGHIQVDSLYAKNLEVNCEVGSIESYETDVTKGNLICEMGSIMMYMKDSEDNYNYTVKSEMGSVTVGGDSYTGLQKKRSVDNGADRNLDMNCEMGSIELYFD